MHFILAPHAGFLAQRLFVPEIVRLEINSSSAAEITEKRKRAAAAAPNPRLES
jgi:hypothetical protein